MTHPSKTKGNGFERECVKKAIDFGFESKRAWGSNGISLGYCPEVDMIIGKLTAQCKRRKEIAEYIKPPAGVDIVLLREDHGAPYVVMPYEKFLQLLKQAQEGVV